MKSDYRYSSGVCYNSFPIMELTLQNKEFMTKHAMNILGIREQFPDRSLADLYDPEKMPIELKEAHEENDAYLESIYSVKGFNNDSERLECLFNLYNEMTGGQNA